VRVVVRQASSSARAPPLPALIPFVARKPLRVNPLWGLLYASASSFGTT
jgi:hypothetical protein